MAAVLGGHDTLLVSPTGSGKSLSYQVPGVLLDGCTIVVSPLLALQHDQIEALAEVGKSIRSVRISSAETENQRDEALAAVADGEAHCVSTWGHDFRPDYFRMGHFIDDLGRPRVIALTATAAKPVRDDIVERLALRKAVVCVTGFDRPNITLGVHRCSDAEEQQQTVVEAVLATPRPGIVYCRTRRATEDYTTALTEAAVTAATTTPGWASGSGRRCTAGSWTTRST